MLDVKHSQIDAETEFDVASLILIFFIYILASIKSFLALCKFP